MKLTELLKQITPLPWRINEHGSVLKETSQLRDKVCLTGFALSMGSGLAEAEANNRYVHHAANALPQLIAAASAFKYEVLVTGGAKQKTIDLLNAALDEAEKVQE